MYGLCEKRMLAILRVGYLKSVLKDQKGVSNGDYRQFNKHGKIESVSDIDKNCSKNPPWYDAL